MTDTCIIVERVGERRRIWVKTPNTKKPLKVWCDEHRVGYQSLWARLADLRPGIYFEEFTRALRAMAKTVRIRREREAIKAAEPKLKPVMTAYQRTRFERIEVALAELRASFIPGAENGPVEREPAQHAGAPTEIPPHEDNATCHVGGNSGGELANGLRDAVS
jgi:hypothetical protein